MLADTDVQQIGFVKRGRFGASPDGLVGSDGLVEFAQSWWVRFD